MQWQASTDPVHYPDAVAAMEKRVQEIISGQADELIWLLEHPSLYTAGTGAKESDLLDSRGFPVYKSGRGGQYTYHGPGQRIAYVMLDLRKRNPDIRAFVKQLERCIIMTLAAFGVIGEIREGRVGVWVAGNTWQESKIAALGIRIRKWVTFHGISINIHPDLSHYEGIVPCGIREYGVTSLKALGIHPSMEKFDREFMKAFTRTFCHQ